MKNALESEETGGIQRRGLVLGALMRFKQICNHPSLFTGDGGYAADASGKFDRLGSLCGEIPGAAIKCSFSTSSVRCASRWRII